MRFFLCFGFYTFIPKAFVCARLRVCASVLFICSSRRVRGFCILKYRRHGVFIIARAPNGQRFVCDALRRSGSGQLLRRLTTKTRSHHTAATTSVSGARAPSISRRVSSVPSVDHAVPRVVSVLLVLPRLRRHERKSNVYFITIFFKKNNVSSKRLGAEIYIPR